MMGVNPLVGRKNISDENKFIDMSEPYSIKLANLLKNSSPVPLKEGVYIGVSGPNFETPAEVKFFSMIGGSAVGMSTVSETLVAKSCGIDTIGLSCITNYTTGLFEKRLNRDEVIEIAKKTETNLISVILNLIAVM
jgi:purine-nucleoside phosphorylase